MRPTSSILGASRLPLTPKRGNKDFYKGTRQSYVPGGGHRTGPPGKHVVQGKAKFRIVDEQVRIFVAPPQGVLASTNLKPYVSTTLPHTRQLRTNPETGTHSPSFSPAPISSTARLELANGLASISTSASTASSPSASSPGAEQNVDESSSFVSHAIANPGKPRAADFREFSKRWKRLSVEDKEAIKMEHRRQWWEATAKGFEVKQAL